MHYIHCDFALNDHNIADIVLVTDDDGIGSFRDGGYRFDDRATPHFQGFCHFRVEARINERRRQNIRIRNVQVVIKDKVAPHLFYKNPQCLTVELGGGEAEENHLNDGPEIEILDQTSLR